MGFTVPRAYCLYRGTDGLGLSAYNGFRIGTQGAKKLLRNPTWGLTHFLQGLITGGAFQLAGIMDYDNCLTVSCFSFRFNYACIEPRRKLQANTEGIWCTSHLKGKT